MPIDFKYSKTPSLILFLFFIFLFTTNISAKQRPKVGLVLSGGGAKGFAHIEILKMLDSLNFPIDYIAGTSMGGIMGGFYAIGYSGSEIENIVREINWSRIFSDSPPRSRVPILEKQYDSEYRLNLQLQGFQIKPPSGFIAGQEIMKVFSRYTNPVSSITNFDEFPIPFRCVAVDIVSGKEVAIDRGYLALAMRSTMSIPSAFAPVAYGDYLFVDGGVANNLPVDVVRKMGAEFVIAVNVGAPPLKRDQINNVLDVTLQTVFIPGFKREEANIAASDIVITPEIGSFGTGDFFPDAINSIIISGKKAASSQKDRLTGVLKEWGITQTDSRDPLISKSQVNDTVSGVKHRITSIQTLRNNLLSRPEITAIVAIDTGDFVEDIDWLENQFLLDNSNLFVTTVLSHKNTSDSTATIFINVREKIQPIIRGVEIHGNETLSFTFIYNLLGLKPGQPFDYRLMNDRLDELYSLGYFQLLYYTLTPYENGRVILNLWVTERSHEKLQLGIKLVEQYNFVAAFGLQMNSILFDGMRFQFNMQVAGFTRFFAHISYPSMQLNNFAYPFARISYERIDEDDFSDQGKIAARYNVDDVSAGGGLGFILSRSAYLEAEIAHHYFSYEGKVATSFGIHTHSTAFLGRLTIDELDDAFIPSKGVLVTANFFGKFKNTMADGFEFYNAKISAEHYQKVNSHLNLKISGKYFHFSTNDVHPAWYFKDLNPYNFFGVEFYQLRYTRLGTLGFKLRHRLSDSYFISAIADLGIGLHNPYFHWNDEIQLNKSFWAAGTELSYNSIIGLMSLQLGSRDRNPVHPGNHEFWSTFSIGLPL